MSPRRRALLPQPDGSSGLLYACSLLAAASVFAESITVRLHLRVRSGTFVGSIFTTTTYDLICYFFDDRLKEDLKSFDAGNIVDDTKVYDFKWKSTGERAYGVIAQQAIEVYPTAVINTGRPMGLLITRNMCRCCCRN